MSSLQILAIQGTHIKGSIPAEIGHLKTLQLLYLDENFLGGDLPRTLGNLSNLEELDLQFNDFTGPIPSELGSCAQLQQFLVGLSSDLGVAEYSYSGAYSPNNLNGSIPESFGQLQNLQLLAIQYTQMGGKIPSFSNATALGAFHVFENQFTGDIPSDFASSLTDLNLVGNRLSGPIPSAFANLTNLVTLVIEEGGIEGIILPELAFCQNLQYIIMGPSDARIWRAKVTGPIPQGFGRLTQLQNLGLWSIELSGTIPSSLGNCSLLTDLILTTSQLVGGLPPEIGNLTALELLYVQGNRLNGSLSAVRWDELRHLTQLDVGQNAFSGTLPESLGALASLLYFGASDNQLGGTLPVLSKTVHPWKYLICKVIKWREIYLEHWIAAC